MSELLGRENSLRAAQVEQNKCQDEHQAKLEAELEKKRALGKERVAEFIGLMLVRQIKKIPFVKVTNAGRDAELFGNGWSVVYGSAMAYQTDQIPGTAILDDGTVITCGQYKEYYLFPEDLVMKEIVGAEIFGDDRGLERLANGLVRNGEENG